MELQASQTWLFWLETEKPPPRLTQHTETPRTPLSAADTAAVAVGGLQAHGPAPWQGRREQGAQGPDLCSVCHFPLQQQALPQQADRHLLHLRGDPTSSHSLQVKTLGYLLNAI